MGAETVEKVYLSYKREYTFHIRESYPASIVLHRGMRRLGSACFNLVVRTAGRGRRGIRINSFASGNDDVDGGASHYSARLRHKVKQRNTDSKKDAPEGFGGRCCT